MNEFQKNASQETNRDAAAANIIEKSTTALVLFVFSYLFTVWTFLRWPFKRSPEILEENRQGNFLPPNSFLFVNLAFFYFLSDRFVRILDLTLLKTGRKPILLPEFSPSNYSLESFIFNTAPLIIAVAMISHVAAWLLGRRDYTVKRKVHSAVSYLSAHALLLPSIATLLVGLAVADIINSVAVPGQVVSEDRAYVMSSAAGTVVSAMLVYSSIGLLTILISFAGAIRPRSDRSWKKAITPFLANVLGIAIFVTAGLLTSFAVTAYRLTGQLDVFGYVEKKNTGMLEKTRLPAVAVISHDKRMADRNEVPVFIAITNRLDRTVLLFTFKSIEWGTGLTDGKGHKWICRFVPSSGQGQFREIKPGAVATVDGKLVFQEKQWRQLLNIRNAWLEMLFLGEYPDSNVGELFYVTAADSPRRVFFDGFEKTPLNNHR